MWEYIKKKLVAIKDSLLFILFIVGLISIPVNVLLWLSKDGWNILDIFILGIIILVIIAK